MKLPCRYNSFFASLAFAVALYDIKPREIPQEITKRIVCSCYLQVEKLGWNRSSGKKKKKRRSRRRKNPIRTIDPDPVPPFVPLSVAKTPRASSKIEIRLTGMADNST